MVGEFKHVEEEVASEIFAPKSLPCDAKWLAGCSSANKVNVSCDSVFIAKFLRSGGDVVVARDVGPMARENVPALVVLFDLSDAGPAQLVEAKFEAADA
jgi:hypothetical protein